MIDENSTISRKEISEKLNINQSAIQKHMDVLKKRGFIKRVGPAKGGHWEILEKLSSDPYNYIHLIGSFLSRSTKESGLADNIIKEETAELYTSLLDTKCKNLP